MDFYHQIYRQKCLLESPSNMHVKSHDALIPNELAIHRIAGNDWISVVSGVRNQLIYNMYSLADESPHSHSIVAGGLPEMSYTTREMPGTSLTMRRAQTSSSA